MEYIKTFEEFNPQSLSMDLKSDKTDIRTSIKYLKKIPKELKDIALDHIQQITKAKNGVITGLTLHKNLQKKISDKKLPNGFSMGIDKNGYFIHTHRARGKSHKTPESITIREIKFINSTS